MRPPARCKTNSLILFVKNDVLFVLIVECLATVHVTSEITTTSSLYFLSNLFVQSDYKVCGGGPWFYLRGVYSTVALIDVS